MESFFRDYGLQILTDEEGNRCLFSKQTLRVSPKDTLQKCYPLDSERFERYFFHGILFTPPPTSQTLPSPLSPTSPHTATSRVSSLKRKTIKPEEHRRLGRYLTSWLSGKRKGKLLWAQTYHTQIDL